MKMRIFLAVLLVPLRVQAAAVFSHFMVGNTQYFTQSDWEANIRKAMSYHIDAFALNMAYGWPYNAAQVSLAFSAANSLGFKLFFSFDYAGNGPWPKADVTQFIQEYGSNGAHYHYNGKPFVSTFEGPGSSGDWVGIKADTGCFFVPDWSSIGAGPALDKGVADGLFSWAAWRWGDWPMNTYTDAAYNISLNGLPYMMPVSPWFYTNLPGFDKNWLWASDDLWFDRWQQVWSFQPEWVEIITWNDFGESHYIGPLDEKQYDLFGNAEGQGKAPYNFADKMPHDAWGEMLPFLIDVYKNGQATIDAEAVYVWHRLTAAATVICDPGMTSGNTASQLQVEFYPEKIVEDSIFFSALLVGPATYTVYIDGEPSVSSAQWGTVPSSGIGMYHASVGFGAEVSGQVSVCISRGQQGKIVCADAGIITRDCAATKGYTNWNAITGVGIGEPLRKAWISQPLSDQVCIKGFGTLIFDTICQFTCSLGYCPAGACSCSNMGLPPVLPKADGFEGYSLNGMVEFEGLCAFACLYGFCGFANNTVCGPNPRTLYTPTVSPFNPPACQSGGGEGDFAALCSWSCQYGYCPIAVCTCHGEGDLIFPPAAASGVKANFTSYPIMAYNDLCTWTCSRGFCPEVCQSNEACTSGSGEGNYGGLCDFSCGYGFCPEPCTCLSQGTLAPPPKFDPTIIGFADSGLDAATYGPLCNFTCSHGYCPSPNACLFEVTVALPTQISLAPAVPTIDTFVDLTDYSAGDLFSYVSSANADLSLDVILVEETTLPTDYKCDTVEPGPLGGVIGCIGEVVEFLELSLLSDPYVVASKRDVLLGTSHTKMIANASTRTSNSSSLYANANANASNWTGTSSNSSKYHYNSHHTSVTHSHWMPEGNCSTTHCMLMAGAPLHTWVSVGNGTLKGALHELSFLNTGRNAAYSATRGNVDMAGHNPRTNNSSSSFAKRWGSSGPLRAQILFDPAPGSLPGWKKANPEHFSNNVADLLSIAAMDSALKNYTTICTSLQDNNSGIPDYTDSVDGALKISFGTDVLTSAGIDNLMSSCTTEESKPRVWVIYPADGNDVGSLQALLSSFPNAKLDTHNSRTTLGVLYWIATLTPSQVIQVRKEKQCIGLHPKCTDDCPSPILDRQVPDEVALQKRVPEKYSTAFIDRIGNATLEGRKADLGTSQILADPSLSFISQLPPNRPPYPDIPDTYYYDSSAGENVFVYVLDSEGYEMKQTEFAPFIDIVPTFVGRPGQSQNVSSAYPHGSGMLAQIVGVQQGVAKKASPRPYSFDNQGGQQWVIEALDKIAFDVLFDRAMAPNNDLNGIAILSMSFSYPESIFGSGFENRFAAVLKHLGTLNVLSICSSGNSFGSPLTQVVHTVPAAFGSEHSVNFVRTLQVVGAVDNYGNVPAFSDDASWVNLFAPGVNYKVPARGTGTTAFGPNYGTSGSAAKTAGLAAYLCGLPFSKTLFPDIPTLMSNIRAYAWDRRGIQSGQPGYVAAISNRFLRL